MKASQRQYEDYVRDMLYAAEKAESFIRGMDFDAFQKDEKTIWAVLKALEIIGEAAKKFHKRCAKVIQKFLGDGGSSSSFSRFSTPLAALNTGSVD